MDVENLGLKIRTFLRNLFGSRLNAHLEEELLRLRSDYETRLMDRERTIAELREQAAQLSSKVDRYELVLLPLASPLGNFFAPKKDRTPKVPLEVPTAKTWPEIQLDWEKQQELEAAQEKQNGPHDLGRQEEVQ